MADVLARRRLLASARAELLEHPDVELPGIPGHVVASWRRHAASSAPRYFVSAGFDQPAVEGWTIGAKALTLR